MDRVFRTGTDLHVALDTAAARRLALHWTPPSPPTNPGNTSADALTGAFGLAQATPRGWRHTVRLGLRLPIRIAYRAARPLLRPLVFRLRRYLTFEIQGDLARYHAAEKQMIESISADILRETQASREQLRQELLGAQQLALTVQRKQFEQRIDSMEATSPQRLLYLFDRMIEAQNLALLEQRRHIDSLEGQRRLAEKLRSDRVDARLDRIESYSYAAARRVSIASGEGRILIKTEAGYVVCPSDDLAVVALLTESGDLEPGTRKLIGKLVGPGDCYVDVGANLGLHTIAAGRAMQHRGTIVAFEPFPRTCELLRETLHINGLQASTTVHQMAVSDHAGRHAFYLGNTCGHHSLFALAGSDASALQPIEVDTVRLDDVLAGDMVVTLLKIDAEGAELDVLRGAVATLTGNPDIGLIVEFGISHLDRNSISTAAWLGEFAAFGFIFRAIDATSGALLEWTPDALQTVDSINLLFARPDSPLWRKAVDA